MRQFASERQIQQAILGYLRYRGYYVMRLNSGAIRVQRSNMKHSLVRLSPPGTPDLLAIKDGRCLFIEVKTGYNKPTELQLRKIAELEEYGAKCILAYSIEDVEKALR